MMKVSIYSFEFCLWWTCDLNIHSWIFIACFMLSSLQKCQTWNKAAQVPLMKTMGESWLNSSQSGYELRTRSSEEIFTTVTSACRSLSLSDHPRLHWRLICILLYRALHKDTVLAHFSSVLTSSVVLWAMNTLELFWSTALYIVQFFIL